MSGRIIRFRIIGRYFLFITESHIGVRTTPDGRYPYEYWAEHLPF